MLDAVDVVGGVSVGIIVVGLEEEDFFGFEKELLFLPVVGDVCHSFIKALGAKKR